MSYLPRSIERALKRSARQFPAVMVTGPRQSGKTTLLNHLFGKSHRYVSMDLPDIRAAALSDPRGFLDHFSPPLIIDEVQHAPDLLPYLRERIDARRSRSGQYLLTGSQNILLSEKVTESLAGRVAVLRLLPLSRREIAGVADLPLPWNRGSSVRPTLGLGDPWPSILCGGFPELVSTKGRDPTLWHASYVQTYLERDVRSLRQVGDLTQFQSFLRAVAARSAQLVNLSELSRDLGVALNTIKAWLSVLEATYQVQVIRPYHANVQKRLVKTPKVYFLDTGSLCYLTGIKDPDHARSGPMNGPLLETAVLSEILRTIVHQGIVDPQIYFWRTATGEEVDFLVDTGERLIPIEVKSTATPNPNMARGIETLKSDLGKRVAKGYVVHLGNATLPLTPNVTAWPFLQF